MTGWSPWLFRGFLLISIWFSRNYKNFTGLKSLYPKFFVFEVQRITFLFYCSDLSTIKPRVIDIGLEMDKIYMAFSFWFGSLCSHFGEGCSEHGDFISHQLDEIFKLILLILTKNCCRDRTQMSDRFLISGDVCPKCTYYCYDNFPCCFSLPFCREAEVSARIYLKWANISIFSGILRQYHQSEPVPMLPSLYVTCQMTVST